MNLSLNPWRRPARSSFLLLVAFLGLAGSQAQGAQGGIEKHIEFRDEAITNKSFRETDMVFRAWTETEKADFLRHLVAAHAKAPQLLERAAALRLIRVCRIKERWGGTVAMAAQSSNYALLITDKSVKEMAGSKLHEQSVCTLLHEFTHLVDFSRRYSSHKDWVAAVKPRLDKVQANFQEKTGLTLAQYFETGKIDRQTETIADLYGRAEGFPRAYAAFALFEALAECTAQILTNPKYAAPPSIDDFIRKKVLAFAEPDTVDRLTNQALWALEKGNKQEAQTALTEALRHEPTYVMGYFWRSMTWSLAKEAVQDLDRAIEVSPDPPAEVFARRGSLLLRLNQPEKAWFDLQEALRRSPTYTDARKAQEEALQKIVAELKSRSVSDRLQAARFLAKIGGDAAAAVQALEATLSDPSPEVRSAVAAALRKIQGAVLQKPRAISEFKIAAAGMPTPGTADLYLLPFAPGHEVKVSLRGDGSSNLDLLVFPPPPLLKGGLQEQPLVKGQGPTDAEDLAFTPARGGSHKFTVANLGNTVNRYTLTAAATWVWFSSIHIERTIPQQETDVFKFAFDAKRTFLLTIEGDGKSNLDVYVEDPFGVEVGRGTSQTDFESVSWTTPITGTYTIRVRNLGAVPNRYMLITSPGRPRS